MKAVAVAVIFCISGVAFAKDHSADHAKNKSGVTAADQGQTQADTDLTRNIRQRIHNDNAISMMGKNVTIISKDGMVVLKGTVSSAAERTKISKIANEVAGKPVTDEMAVSK